MINFFSTWAEQIIVAIVIATIIEMILPSGTSKKYIKAVIGVYIMFTIISPILGKFINLDFSNINYEKYFEEFETTETLSINLNSSNDKSVKEIYVENLKQDMRAKLKKQGYVVENIELQIESENEENFGDISWITLTLYKEDEDKHASKIIINKVEIGNTVTTTSQNENKEKLTDSEKNEIKDYLVGVYEVKKKNIKINE